MLPTSNTMIGLFHELNEDVKPFNESLNSPETLCLPLSVPENPTSYNRTFRSFSISCMLCSCGTMLARREVIRYS